MSIADEFGFLVLTFVREPIRAFQDRLRRQLALDLETPWQFEKAELDWRGVYFPEPQPGAEQPLRAAAWSPESHPDCSVFFPNAADGWSLLIRRMSEEGMPDSIGIRTTRKDRSWQCQEICYRRSGQGSGRLLQTIDDIGRRKYWHEGEPLEFEPDILKRANRISSRDEVLRYVRQLGVDLLDDLLWSSREPALYIAERRVT